MRRGHYLWLAGWSLILAGCTCGEKVKGPSGKKSVEAKVRKVLVKPRLRPPPVTIREPMRSLQETTEEMRRRARAGLSMAGPARSIRFSWKRVEWNRYPKNFKPFYDALDSQAAALERSKDQAQDYNKLVNSCIACHHIFAKDYISVVKKLPLSKEELKEARRRAEMRAKRAKRGSRGKVE